MSAAGDRRAANHIIEQLDADPTRMMNRLLFFVGIVPIASFGLGLLIGTWL